MKNIFFLLICSFISCCFAATPQQLIASSQQLLIVITPNENVLSGHIQRFARPSVHSTWRAVDDAIPIVIGRKGMSVDPHFVPLPSSSVALKQEGDDRTPMGVYTIGPIFGFDKTNHYRSSYIPLKNTSVCVDDPKSLYYNQIIDGAESLHHDWDSGEKMRQIPQYRIGVVVQYNVGPIIPGQGSCIFIHRWKNSATGTAGCIAMNEIELEKILDWLDTEKKPIIALLSRTAYARIMTKWKLPALNG